MNREEKIYRKMVKIDKDITCEKFHYHVKVRHLDGSFFDLPLAFYTEDEFIYYVYTEHTGFMHFFKEDIKSFEVKDWNEKRKKKNAVNRNK